jgi:hypothetical protein
MVATVYTTALTLQVEEMAAVKDSKSESSSVVMTERMMVAMSTESSFSALMMAEMVYTTALTLQVEEMAAVKDSKSESSSVVMTERMMVVMSTES